MMIKGQPHDIVEEEYSSGRSSNCKGPDMEMSFTCSGAKCTPLWLADSARR